MNTDRVLEIVVFLAVVGVFFLFGTIAAVRVVGVVTLASGLFAVRTRRLGVGIEGRPPSFHLRGISAVFSGIVIAALGCALVWFAPEAACLLSSGKECVT